MDPKGLQLESISWPEKIDFFFTLFEFFADFSLQNVNGHKCFTLIGSVPGGGDLLYTDEPLECIFLF